MKIIFCGTRGYIEESSPLHAMHSACLLVYRGRRLLLDFGENWAGRLAELAPDWIAITHAHPDHSFGLRQGAGVPVFVTQESRDLLKDYPVADFRTVAPGRHVAAGPFDILPYAVIHSIRAPAVGYRVAAGSLVIAYNADLVAIERKEEILTGVDVYIGDGSTLVRPMVRRRGEAIFGHTTVRAQLNWCRQFGIPRAFIVHCGKELVEMPPDELDRRVAALAGDVQATVATDGLEVRLSKRKPRARTAAS